MERILAGELVSFLCGVSLISRSGCWKHGSSRSPPPPQRENSKFCERVGPVGVPPVSALLNYHWRLMVRVGLFENLQPSGRVWLKHCCPRGTPELTLVSVSRRDACLRIVAFRTFLVSSIARFFAHVSHSQRALVDSPALLVRMERLVRNGVHAITGTPCIHALFSPCSCYAS